eukprot:scaffold2846_cov322-Pavlova_lutheri.AAC.19
MDVAADSHLPLPLPPLDPPREFLLHPRGRGSSAPVASGGGVVDRVVLRGVGRGGWIRSSAHSVPRHSLPSAPPSEPPDSGFRVGPRGFQRCLERPCSSDPSQGRASHTTASVHARLSAVHLPTLHWNTSIQLRHCCRVPCISRYALRAAQGSAIPLVPFPNEPSHPLGWGVDSPNGVDPKDNHPDGNEVPPIHPGGLGTKGMWAWIDGEQKHPHHSDGRKNQGRCGNRTVGGERFFRPAILDGLRPNRNDLATSPRPKGMQDACPTSGLAYRNALLWNVYPSSLKKRWKTSQSR